ncbi:MAG: M16 family metallopeptidase, partial [Gemmatimonadaceae bacterium]
ASHHRLMTPFQLPSLRAALAAISLAGAARVAAQVAPSPGPVSKDAPTAAASSLATADTSAPLPADPKVRAGVLPNGLHYYVRANSRPEKRAELRLAVNAGAVLEDPDQRGMAHFVEHMAFNGTRRFAKNDIINFMESIGMRFGADLNAYTGFDETVYELQVPTDSARALATAIDILDDWASGAVLLDSAEVERERGVVLEEWRSRRGADIRMAERQYPVYFAGTPYADHFPIGSPESIQKTPPSAIRRFYETWYRPDLMAVVAVGDFDAAAVERMIRERFSDIPARQGARARPSHPVPAADSTRFAVATDPEAQRTTVGLLFGRPVTRTRTVADFRRAIVQDLYDFMLNQRFDEIVQKPDAPFAAAGSGQGQLVRGAEVYQLNAVAKPGDVERALEALVIEARRVEQHGFTAGELERAKKDFLRSMEQRYAEREKTPSSAFADQYVNAFLEGDPAPGVEAEYALHRRFLPTITVNEVNRLARGLVASRNRIVSVSAPETAGAPVPGRAALLAAMQRARGAPVTAYADSVTDAPLVATPPRPGSIASTRQLPEVGVTLWTLSNGVRVFLKPTDFKADEIVLRAWSPGGTSLVADSDFVSASLASLVVGGASGVGAFDQVALGKRLAGTAVRVGPSIGSLEEGLSGSASPRDVETLFELAFLYVTAPRKDTAAYKALQQQFRTVLANRAASPQAAFQDTLAVTLTQHHPRSRPLTLALLDEAKLDRMYAIYRDRFADAGDFTFVLVGNFSPDSIRPLVLRWLGGLPSAGRREAWKDVGVRAPRGVVERSVRKGLDPKSQTALVFTGPAPDVSLRARYVMSALREALNITVRERLREALGGTYSPSVDAGLSRIPRPEYSVSVSYPSSPERADELVKAVFAEIAAVQANGVSDSVLAKVKEIHLRERETALRQNGFWAAQIVARDQYGEPLADILLYDKLVAALTNADIRDAARLYLDPKNYVRVTLYPEDKR